MSRDGRKYSQTKRLRPEKGRQGEREGEVSAEQLLCAGHFMGIISFPLHSYLLLGLRI